MTERLTKLLDREGTGISWAHLTMNFWIGCQEVGPACDHCYARVFAETRLKNMGVVWGPGGARIQTKPATRRKALRWNAVAAEAGVVLNVFCSSLSDWADNAVPDAWRTEIADMVRATPNLRWMMLTKRIGNAQAMLESMFPEGVPDNVCLGVTIANQAEVERDLPKAVAVKQALGIRRLFLSMEPLLGPVDFAFSLPEFERVGWVSPLEYVDLVICGGESGSGYRLLHPDWVRLIRDQCAAVGVPFHFKQWGECKPYVAGERGDVFWLDPDGHVYGGPTSWPPQENEPRAPMWRSGVRRAGHLLDGREHREHFA